MESINGEGNGHGGGGGGGPPACASCKHQRKKCTPSCDLAPYFPATKVLQFKAVHSVFGVSNVSKMLKKVPGGNHLNRLRAVDSLVWEAQCRQRDPVLGPYGEYLQLVIENQRLRRERLLCARCGSLASLSLNNMMIQNNGNRVLHFTGTQVQTPLSGEGFISYLHHNGNLIVEPGHNYLAAGLPTRMKNRHAAIGLSQTNQQRDADQCCDQLEMMKPF